MGSANDLQVYQRTVHEEEVLATRATSMTPLFGSGLVAKQFQESSGGRSACVTHGIGETGGVDRHGERSPLVAEWNHRL